MKEDRAHAPETPIEQRGLTVYQSRVEQAKKEIEGITFSADDMPELFKRLRLESQTAQVLIFSSYFEEQIKNSTKAKSQKHQRQSRRKEIIREQRPARYLQQSSDYGLPSRLDSSPFKRKNRCV